MRCEMCLSYYTTTVIETPRGPVTTCSYCGNVNTLVVELRDAENYHLDYLLGK